MRLEDITPGVTCLERRRRQRRVRVEGISDFRVQYRDEVTLRGDPSICTKTRSMGWRQFVKMFALAEIPNAESA